MQIVQERLIAGEKLDDIIADLNTTHKAVRQVWDFDSMGRLPVTVGLQTEYYMDLYGEGVSAGAAKTLYRLTVGEVMMLEKDTYTEGYQKPVDLAANEQFILDNHRKLTIDQMANALDISRYHVKKTIDKLDLEPLRPVTTKHKQEVYKQAWKRIEMGLATVTAEANKLGVTPRTLYNNRG